MSKLPSEHKFIDFSDYGRPVARAIANGLKDTSFTPIHVTTAFIVSGLLAIWAILYGYYWAAAFFLIAKSILDAADGELARVKGTPSYIGRYYDSIADILLNLLFLLTIWYVTSGSLGLTLLAFVGIQLQGTLYNYYYVILRNNHDGDTTSRVFETESPVAFPGEKQPTVDRFYWTYNMLYVAFDKAIYYMDRPAAESSKFPKWFMSAVSTFGLGFQLLIISVMLVLGLIAYIIPFFIAYSVLIVLYIAIRRSL